MVLLEFKFVDLDDALPTGSSIMPRRRTRCGRAGSGARLAGCTGDLITLLTMMKGLPLAYNKDMQEDKEALFDAIDTVRCACLSLPPW